MPWPTCAFEHLDESFDPSTEVPDDHPMVAARPDLFTTAKPTTRRKPAAPKD